MSTITRELAIPCWDVSALINLARTLGVPIRTLRKSYEEGNLTLTVTVTVK